MRFSRAASARTELAVACPLDLAARLIAQDEAPVAIERGDRKAHPVEG